jgi:hypothetical protein
VITIDFIQAPGEIEWIDFTPTPAGYIIICKAPRRHKVNKDHKEEDERKRKKKNTTSALKTPGRDFGKKEGAFLFIS